MFFKDIIGQQDVARQLINTVKNQRISHAVLLHGKGCVGKIPLALAMARYVHCENPGPDDACGVCPACKKHSGQVHPDMHFVFPVFNDSKRKKISDSYIEEWREQLKSSTYFSLSQWLDAVKSKDSRGKGEIYAEESMEIIRKLSLKTYESEYKIILIAFADRMNTSASNKLLKILEEPAEKTLFILTAEDTTSLLPTILSRCQCIPVKPIDRNDLFEALLKSSGYPPAEITSAVNISQGCYCRAMTYLETSGENQEMLDSFVRIMRGAYAGNLTDMIAWAEELARKHGDEQKQYLNYYSAQLRSNFVRTVNAPSIANLSAGEEEFSGKFHPFIHSRNIFRFREEIEKALFHLERNGNATLIFVDLAIAFHRLLKLPKN